MDDLADILNALERQAAALDAQAEQLFAVGDYSAEFFSEDARLLRAAAKRLSA